MSARFGRCNIVRDEAGKALAALLFVLLILVGLIAGGAYFMNRSGNAILQTIATGNDKNRIPVNGNPVGLANAPTATMAFPVESAQAGRSGAEDGATHIPLPPPGTPLATVYEALKLRADQGDVTANCRLGTELARCALLPVAQSRLDSLVKETALVRPDSYEESTRLAEMDKLAAKIQRLQASCGELPADAFAKRPWEYVYFAADQGDIPSILAFAVYPPMDPEQFTAELEGWKVFHEEAGRLLELAAHKGSPTAMFQLAWAYANYPVAGGSPIVPFDPVKAVAWATLARPYADNITARTIDSLIAKMQSAMVAGQMADAEKMVESLRIRISVAPDFAKGDFVNSSIPAPAACGSRR